MEPSPVITPDSDHDTRVYAVVDLLLTVGYIDGLLHDDEQAFIRHYLDQLVEHVAQPPSTADTWRVRFAAAYARLDTEIASLAAEVVAAGDEHYMQTRLKVRAVALFRAFSPADQEVALELLNVMVHADGTISPQERELHDELRAYFNAAPTIPTPAAEPPPGLLRIAPPQSLALTTFTHAWLDALEQRYSADPAVLLTQLDTDYNLIFQAVTVWERHRARGNGRLMGITDIGQLPPGTRMLDGHIHVLRPDHPTELVVLGDLHGCYGCLKGALLQSDFIERALRHQADPANNPDVKLVLLGDYIDRGRFSFEGVMRAALQLLVTLPDHVVLLRGNHEFLVRVNGQIASGVNPAEAVPSLAERAPVDILEAYRHLFEHMPTAFLFDRTLFVHAGIPRDDTMERIHDLSGLEDPVVRFEMMWSDPVATDRVPLELQRESPRFNFGRDQFRVFMERIGCHTLIRGHEQINAGFATTFDIGSCRLHTLFSAGGQDNSDLPAESGYRSVTPMALTIRSESGSQLGVPWPIEYAPFNTGTHNGLYR